MSISIFEFSNYRPFLRDFIQKMPKQGRGVALALANHIGIHPSHISQVLAEDRDLSIEQAVAVAEYFQFSRLESDYFLQMVQFSRAGTRPAKNFFQQKMVELKQQSKNISRRINQDRILSDEQKSIFYSSPLYSAIRLFSSLAGGVSLEEILLRFEIDRVRALQIIEFLLSSGLLLQNEDGKYQMGTQHTHVEKGSPHLIRHHLNWRLQSMQKTETLSDDELQFTGPVSLSREDFDRVREVLLASIKSSLDIVKASPAEDVACINVDLFWVGKGR